MVWGSFTLFWHRYLLQLIKNIQNDDFFSYSMLIFHDYENIRVWNCTLLWIIEFEHWIELDRFKNISHISKFHLRPIFIWWKKSILDPLNVELCFSDKRFCTILYILTLEISHPWILKLHSYFWTTWSNFDTLRLMYRFLWTIFLVFIYTPCRTSRAQDLRLDLRYKIIMWSCI